MSEKREFPFTYRAGGRMQHVKVVARSYPLACYKLGTQMAETFRATGVPADLELQLSEPGTCQLCGCTEEDCSQCMEATAGRGCSWANHEQTICTACAGGLLRLGL